MDDFRNILVIRLRAFGDTLLTTPLLRGLKQAWPKAKVSIVLEPAIAAVVRGLPYVDEVVSFDRQAFKARGWWGEAGASLRFFRQLRARRYDLVLDVLGTSRTAMMSLATGAPVRAGFAFRFRRFAYNRVWTPSKERRYIADYTADLLRLFGHEPDSLKLDFSVPETARLEAGRILRSLGLERGAFVAVSPSGGWELKRYPIPLLRRALGILQERSGLPILLLWGPGEETLALDAAEGVSPRPLVAPATDFALLAALLEGAALLLTNDGAPKHLAVALGTPTLTLFGLTSDVAWHPSSDPRHRSLHLNLECMPCEALTCRFGTQACLGDLPPERVVETALEMLS
jgi:ADP-heptose:LPS heptosyltransferase